MKIILYAALFIATISGKCYAQDKQLIDVPRYMAEESTDLKASLWKLRIFSHMTLARQAMINDFILWCSEEKEKSDPGNTNHVPCQIYAQDVAETEQTTIRTTKLLSMAIEAREERNETDEDLKSQYDYLIMQRDKLSKMPLLVHLVGEKLLEGDEPKDN